MYPHIPHLKNTDTKSFFLIAGTCVVESEEITYQTAHKLQQITKIVSVDWICGDSQRSPDREADAVDVHRCRKRLQNAL